MYTETYVYRVIGCKKQNLTLAKLSEALMFSWPFYTLTIWSNNIALATLLMLWVKSLALKNLKLRQSVQGHSRSGCTKRSS